MSGDRQSLATPEQGAANDRTLLITPFVCAIVLGGAASIELQGA